MPLCMTAGRLEREYCMRRAAHIGFVDGAHRAVRPAGFGERVHAPMTLIVVRAVRHFNHRLGGVCGHR